MKVFMNVIHLNIKYIEETIDISQNVSKLKVSI